MITSNPSTAMSNMLDPFTPQNTAGQMSAPSSSLLLDTFSRPDGFNQDLRGTSQALHGASQVSHEATQIHMQEEHELPAGHACPLTYSLPRPSSSGDQTLPERIFNPKDLYSGDLTIDDIQIRVGQFIFLACPMIPPCRHGHMAPHMEFPVISIHGSCSGDGTDTARGAIGVWFGESPKNLRQPLDSLERCTGQIADLYAVIAALSHVAHSLEKWSRNRSDGHEKVPARLHTVVIKTDSGFVMNVTGLLGKWKSQGWKRGGRGKQIANRELWKQIDDYLVYLEGKGKIRVKFWKVDASQNEVAVNLAAHALQYPPMHKELDALMRKWNYPFN